MKRIERLQEIAVFHNEYGTLYNDLVRGPTGKTGHYLRWKWNGGSGVIVVPVFEGMFALRRMHRYSPDILSLEFAGGGINEGEDPVPAARRELEEEFGLQAGNVQIIGQVYPDTGILQNPLFVALAEVLDPSVHQPKTRQEDFEAIDDEDEHLVWMDKSEFLRAVAEGEIRAGTTLSAALLYLARLGG